jgi:hypothetical protein
MAKYRDTFETIGGQEPREIEAIFYDGSETQARELADRFPRDLSICMWRPDPSAPLSFSSLGEIHGAAHHTIPAQTYIVVKHDSKGSQRAYRSGYDRPEFEKRYQSIEA